VASAAVSSLTVVAVVAVAVAVAVVAAVVNGEAFGGTGAAGARV
jgi:hypothetical protein